MALNKKSGYWVTQLENVGEPLRTSHWKLNFNFSDLIAYEKYLGYGNNVFSGDIISLATKNYEPPTVHIATEAIYFQGGAKKSLPVVHDYEDTFTVTMLETNDLACHKNILRWMQFCINDFSVSTRPIGNDITTFDKDNYNSIEGYGAPLYKNQDKYTSTNNAVYGNFFVNHNVVYADIYDYVTGEIVMRVRYVNIFPIKISSPKLEYNSSNLYEFTVEFKFSRFVYVLPASASTSVSSNSYNSQTATSFGRRNNRNND